MNQPAGNLAVSEAEQSALREFFPRNFGRRGTKDLEPMKMHLVDMTDGNRQHPVTVAIKAGHPKPSAPPTHIHGLMIGRRLMVA